MLQSHLAASGRLNHSLTHSPHSIREGKCLFYAREMNHKSTQPWIISHSRWNTQIINKIYNNCWHWACYVISNGWLVESWFCIRVVSNGVKQKKKKKKNTHTHTHREDGKLSTIKFGKFCMRNAYWVRLAKEFHLKHWPRSHTPDSGICLMPMTIIF